ncbi:MAG: CPBP family intramembrane metalloprotease [Leptolyngbyaceae cyanobacterium CSU_1_3]|nr:CPBP family intramembrane metalloprotease [Leptolyngbyaceae cyanobacterium CSU_1_3]
MPTLDRTSQFFAAFAEASVFVRVGVFFAIWLMVWLPIAIPLSIWLKWQPFKPLEIHQKLPLVVSLYLVAPIVLGSIAWLQNTPFSSYGLLWNLNTLRSLGIGMGLGAIGLILLFMIQVGLRWVAWQPEMGAKFRTVLLPTLLLGLFVGGIEELVFRGFLFNQLLMEVDFWTAAIVSSLIFALLHLVWEGTANIPQLPGLSLMGVVLCLALTADGGNIGLAWGLHAGWVWTIATIDSAQLLPPTERSPEWLAGSGGTPLSGLMGLLFLLATGLLLVPLKTILQAAL